MEQNNFKVEPKTYKYIYKCSWIDECECYEKHTSILFLNKEDCIWVFEKTENFKVELIRVLDTDDDYHKAWENSIKYTIKTYQEKYPEKEFD